MFKGELKNKANEDICILLSLDNHSHNYICECGEASELSAKDCINTKAIFISHTHIDHFIGFDKILRFQLGMGEEVSICGPAGIAQQVQAKIKGYQWNLIEANSISYEIREITSSNSYDKYRITPPLWELKLIESKAPLPLYANADFEVQFEILDHKTPSIAYLFRSADTVKIDIEKAPFAGGAWVKLLKSAFEKDQPSTKINIEGNEYIAGDLFHLLNIKKGHTLGVIMDHGATPENHEKIKRTFANVDQVFIESFFKNEDRSSAKDHFHSYAAASGQIMRDCQVAEAIPVHYSRKYGYEDIKVLKEEFYHAFGNKNE